MRERFKSFTLLMASINRSIRRMKAEEMAEFGLKTGHVSCLYYLYRHGALTPTELCLLCEEDKANISRSIDFLEKSGYLVSEGDAARRYKRSLALTEQGERIARDLEARINAVLANAGKGVSDEERAIMYRCLETINSNLQSICDEYDREKREHGSIQEETV